MKATNSHSQDSECPSRDSNRIPPEYDSTILPICSAQESDFAFTYSLVWHWGHAVTQLVRPYATSWKVTRVPDEVDFSNLPNLSSHTMALGSTQPVTEMSTRNFPGGKKRPARRADNLAAIYEPNV
jgi:hypothetical protein